MHRCTYIHTYTYTCTCTYTYTYTCAYTYTYTHTHTCAYTHTRKYTNVHTYIQKTASIAVRLCDVSVDGAATLVSWGLMNLAYRKDKNFEFPEDVAVDEEIDVMVPLKMCGYRSFEGHRCGLRTTVYMK